MKDEPKSDRRTAIVPPGRGGGRLDVFLAEHFPLYSRRQLTRVVKAGHVRVNGRRARPGLRIDDGDTLELPVWSKVLPEITKQREIAQKSSRQMEEVVELYRDDDLLIVSKPAGVPVHGGAGVMLPTLIDILREDILDGFGLVHRLDKDTTGAIALVRDPDLRRELSERFADPEGGVHKVYEAIVSGVPDPAAGVIDLPLVPPAHRGVARVDHDRGRPSQTRYTTVESFMRAARLELVPLTGRTHQLRVHLAEIGCPLLVDPLYVWRKAWKIPDPRGVHPAKLTRTPLHARDLTLPHPRTGEVISVRAPLPDDIRYALEVLRVAAGRGRKRGGLPPTEDEAQVAEEKRSADEQRAADEPPTP